MPGQHLTINFDMLAGNFVGMKTFAHYPRGGVWPRETGPDPHDY